MCIKTQKFFLLPKYNCEVAAVMLIHIELQACSLEEAVEEVKNLPGGSLGIICQEVVQI
jgi:hypothetical protein